MEFADLVRAGGSAPGAVDRGPGGGSEMRRIAGFHSWLRDLPEQVRNAVLGRMRPREYGSGAAVWHLGDAASECDRIESGRVRFSNVSYTGKEVQIVEFHAGDCLGEMSLIDGLPRFNNAYASEPTRLTVLSKQDFDELYARHPEISRQLNVFFCRRLRIAYASAEDASALTLRDRVTRLIARLGSSAERVSAETILSKLSHESLARMLGASRQSVNRELKELEREGLIRISYGRIAIPDLTRLVRHCDQLIGAESIVPDYRGD